MVRYNLKYQDALAIINSFVNDELPSTPGHDQQVRIAYEIVVGNGNPSRGREVLAKFAIFCSKIQIGE